MFTCVDCGSAYSKRFCCRCPRSPRKKPRATVKAFPGISIVQARKLIKTTNQIIDILWPMTPRMRREVLSKAIEIGS